MITPNIIERSWIQGATVAVEYLTGTAFSGENGAHTFRITGKNAEGQPVAVSGTVLAKILRADNITVDVSGSVVDGVAEVTLVGDCYNVPGRTSLVIFLSDGTNTVTLYAAVFNVYRSTSGNEIDSGVNIPSLAELLAQIERMETATAAAEAVVESIEPRVEKLEETVLTDAIVEWNQYNTNGGGEGDYGGIDFTKAADIATSGKWTMTGTCTSTTIKQLTSSNGARFVNGHVYYLTHGAGIDGSGDTFQLVVNRGGASSDYFSNKDGVIITVSASYNRFGIRVIKGYTTPENGQMIQPWYCDLTQMFGAGNEPQSVEEFREMFKADYYPYDEGTEIRLTALDLMNRQIGRLKHAVNQLQPSGTPLMMSAPRMSMPQMTLGTDGGEAVEE